MSKYIKIRKRKAIIKIILLLAIALITIIAACSSNYKGNVNAKDDNLKKIQEEANILWSQAYKLGKRKKEDITSFIIAKLEEQGVNTNKYYITLEGNNVLIANKPNALLAKPGYYKAGTDYTEILKSWEELKNQGIVRVSNGKLLYSKEISEEVDIVLDSSIKEIGEKVFYETKKVESVIIPDSVTDIGDKAFQKSNIKVIMLGKGIKKLNQTFIDMNKLQMLLFTDSITNISDYTFTRTKSLSTIHFVGDITALVTIELEGNEGTPAYESFANLYINGLYASSVNIPEGVTKIRDYALYNYTNIENIVIPKSVREIGSFAFANTELTSIEYKGTKSEWEKIHKYESWDGNNFSYKVLCIDGVINVNNIDKQ